MFTYNKCFFKFNTCSWKIMSLNLTISLGPFETGIKYDTITGRVYPYITGKSVRKTRIIIYSLKFLYVL